MPEELHEEMAGVRCARPSAQEIFTDRYSEQLLINRLLDSLESVPYVKPDKSLISFYGVGGIGKSTLLEKVGLRRSQKSVRSSDNRIRIASVFCDFDCDDLDPGSSIMATYGNYFRKALHMAGIKTPLFDVLYTAWWGKTKPNASIKIKDDIPELVGAGEKGSETLSIVLKSIGDAIWEKAAATFKTVDLVNRLSRQLKEHLNSELFYELFPKQPLGELSAKQMEQLVGRIVAIDILRALDEDRTLSLCIVIDGFERIQSQTDDFSGLIRRDLEESVQSLFRCLVQRNERVGIIVFGRQKLAWDIRYDTIEVESGWSRYIDEHLLVALGEADARGFLSNVVEWCSQRPASRNLGDTIEQHVDAILASSEEYPGQSPRQFYPYSLDLAIDLIANQGERFTEDMLGRYGSAELQERFLRYMNDQKRKAFQVLSLVSDFDRDLFNFLIDDNRITLQKQDFYVLVEGGATYIKQLSLEGANPAYCFHRKMRLALSESMAPYLRQSYRAVVGDLVKAIAQYYLTRLKDQKTDIATSSAARLYSRICHLLICYIKDKSLTFPIWEQLFWEAQSNTMAFFNLETRKEFIEEALNIILENLSDYPERSLVAAKYFNELGTIKKELGDFNFASVEYAQALEYYTQAKNNAPAIEVNDDLLAASIHHNFALALKEDGKTSAAEENFYEAIRLYSKRPEKVERLALAKLSLASIIRKQRRKDAIKIALTMGHDALEILQDSPDPAKQIFALGALAATYRQRRDSSTDLTMAINLQRKAIELSCAHNGSSHPDTAYGYFQLGETFALQGERGELAALDFLDEAKKILVEWGFEDHPYFQRIERLRQQILDGQGRRVN